MDANLDLLLTIVYGIADDFLPRRPGNARRKITDAEIVALCVAQAIMGIPSDPRFLAVAANRLVHLFPQLPARDAFHKRRLRLSPQIEALIAHFARQSPGYMDELLLVDSTPVECARSRETVKRGGSSSLGDALSNAADDGDCASHSRDFWGFRLHALFAPNRIRLARQPERRRRPRVSLRCDRVAFSLGPVQQRVDVIPGDAERSPNTDRRQDALVNPVPDRLGGYLELLGDLRDGEQRVAHDDQSNSTSDPMDAAEPAVLAACVPSSRAMSAESSSTTTRASSTARRTSPTSDAPRRRRAATSRSTRRPNSTLTGVEPRPARNALQVSSLTWTRAIRSRGAFPLAIACCSRCRARRPICMQRIRCTGRCNCVRSGAQRRGAGMPELRADRVARGRQRRLGCSKWMRARGYATSRMNVSAAALRES
jgi:hypothetical protein